MRILLTGDKGKLGSLTRPLLEAAGHEVVGYDLRDGLDIGDLETLTRKAQGCEAIIHLAGIPHPNKGHMVRYFEINVQGTLNVLRAAQECGVKRVVYSSITGYYGCDVRGTWTPLYLDGPVDEQHPPLAVHGQFIGALDQYNQSKVVAEQLLAWYGTNQIVETAVLRIAPANTKAQQYPKGEAFNYAGCKDWRRGALWANCHPEYAATALALAATTEGPFWYDVFNIVDRYLPAGLEGESAFDTTKAQMVLGWEPCEDR